MISPRKFNPIFLSDLHSKNSSALADKKKKKYKLHFKVKFDFLSFL